MILGKKGAGKITRARVSAMCSQVRRRAHGIRECGKEKEEKKRKVVKHALMFLVFKCADQPEGGKKRNIAPLQRTSSQGKKRSRYIEIGLAVIEEVGEAWPIARISSAVT